MAKCTAMKELEEERKTERRAGKCLPDGRQVNCLPVRSGGQKVNKRKFVNAKEKHQKVNKS